MIKPHSYLNIYTEDRLNRYTVLFICSSTFSLWYCWHRFPGWSSRITCLPDGKTSYTWLLDFSPHFICMFWVNILVAVIKIGTKLVGQSMAYFFRICAQMSSLDEHIRRYFHPVFWISALFLSKLPPAIDKLIPQNQKHVNCSGSVYLECMRQNPIHGLHF